METTTTDDKRWQDIHYCLEEIGKGNYEPIKMRESEQLRYLESRLAEAKEIYDFTPRWRRSKRRQARRAYEHFRNMHWAYSIGHER